MVRLSYLLVVLFVALNTSASCDRNLKNSFFSEMAIAKTIEDLGKDGIVFVHMLHGIPYEKIAKRFKMTVDEVRAIAYSGHALLMYYKDTGV